MSIIAVYFCSLYLLSLLVSLANHFLDPCDTLGLYDLGSFRFCDGRRWNLGRYPPDWRYEGELRCDLHPRWAPAGDSIVFDSAHAGGRAIYRLSLEDVLGEKTV